MRNQSEKYVWYMYKSGAICVLCGYTKESDIDLPDGTEISKDELVKKKKLTTDEVLKMDKIGIRIDSSLCGRKAAEEYCKESFIDGDMVNATSPKESLNDCFKKLIGDPRLADPHGMFECVYGCVVSEEYVKERAKL